MVKILRFPYLNFLNPKNEKLFYWEYIKIEKNIYTNYFDNNDTSINGIYLSD